MSAAGDLDLLRKIMAKGLSRRTVNSWTWTSLAIHGRLRWKVTKAQIIWTMNAINSMAPSIYV